MSKRKNTFEIRSVNRSVNTQCNRRILVDDAGVNPEKEMLEKEMLQIAIYESGGRGFLFADNLDKGQVKDLARALLSWLEYHGEADARSGMKPRRVAKLETQVRNLKNALKNVQRELKHAAAQFGSLVEQAEIEQAD